MATERLVSYAEEKKRQKRKVDRQSFRRVLALFRPYTLQVVLVILIILCVTALNIVPALLIPLIFDKAIPQRDASLLLVCVALLVLLPLLSGVLNIGQTYVSNRLGQGIIRDMRDMLYAHLHKMAFRFFTTARTGELQSRLSNDVNGVQGVVIDTMTRLITNITVVLGTIFAMFYLSPLLTLITLLLLPFFFVITTLVGNAGRRIQKATQQSQAELTTLTQETLSVSGILLIKLFGRQEYARELFARHNQKLTTLQIRQQVLIGSFLACVNVIFAITPAVVYLIAGWQLITSPAHAGITIGAIVAFTTLQARFLPAVGQALNVQVNIQGSLAIFERIFEYLDLPVEIQDAPGAISLSTEQTQGHVRFQDVSFRYENRPVGAAQTSPDATRDITPDAASEEASEEASEKRSAAVRAISFEMQPGQLVALVGPSGAGKTTITYLLARLYDVDKGSIEIDGHNLKEITLASLSDTIGVVTQETYLFNASIRENLLYVKPGATEEELIQATKAAAIHERIMGLENGYDTLVGERGYKLSGGEKQRLAIARVLLKNPRILILDEATSSLDTHAERQVQTALESLMKNRTTLAIAHRLSTIQTADLILVIENGSIVEAGTHQQLLQSDGLYTSLYRQQFAHEVEEALPAEA